MKAIKSLPLALAAVLITILSVWYIQRPVAPKQATWDDVIAEAEAGGYNIITTEELAGRYRLGASNPMLIDTRQEWEYRTGHIPGALNFPMEPTRWSRWRKAGKLKAFLGPDKERALVFY
ncbi:MAG: rhodanese-like domain-containing protein [Desulfobacterales bacterium]|nr:rhodanese-like domain-containing protein [Desulfobacterales bacterium]